MVLAAPGTLLTPPPSSSPPKTPHRSYSAQTRSQNEEKNPPPTITSDRKPTQQTTRYSWRGRTGRERPDVEADVDEGGPRLQAATYSVACVAAPQQYQTPPPATRHSPQGAAPRHGEGGQCRSRTVAPRHTACCGPRPGPAPATARPAAAAPHDTSPANNNRPEEMRTSCCQQFAPPPIGAAKMSIRISIGPEPVLAANAPSPPAAGSHCPAREVIELPIWVHTQVFACAPEV
jgi:hypothetical protein